MTAISSSQMRALHAQARKCDLDHDALRGLAQQGFRVDSLRDLSSDQARRLLDRLSSPREVAVGLPPASDAGSAAPASSRSRPPRLPAGCIRLVTREQRQALYALCRALRELGWTDAKCAGWLRRRHGITDIDAGTFSSSAASAAITELRHVLAAERQRLNPGGTGGTGGTGVTPVAPQPSRDREEAGAHAPATPEARG